MPAPLKEFAGKIISDKNYREIISKSGANFSIRILGVLVGYLFVFLVSRFYGPDVLGMHMLSLTVLMIFTVIGRLGMDSALVRHIAAAAQSNSWELVKETYFKTLSVIIPFGILLSLILYISSPYIAEYLFNKPHLTPYFRTISFAVLPMTMRYITSECYRGMKETALYAYSQNVSYFLFASVFLGILTLYSDSPLNPNYAYVCSLGILFFSGIYFINKRISRHTSEASNEWTKAGLVKFAVPMLFTGSLLLISGWFNTIILGVYSTEADVGIYSVVLKIATLSSFILLSINSIAAPKFAQLHAAGDPVELNRYAAQTAKVIFFSSLPVFLVIILFRHWVLMLFGSEFLIGSTALLIVMAGQFFNFFAGSVGHYLNMTGHQVQMRNIVLICALLNLALCFILIPKYGLLGSAIVSAIFMASWNIFAMIYIRIKFGARTYYWPV